MGIKKFTSEGRSMSLTPQQPPSPLEKSIYFSPYRPRMHGPLPAELKFRENTGSIQALHAVILACTSGLNFLDKKASHSSIRTA